MEKNSRNLGLDIVRSIAIILVLICHSNTFFSGDNVKIISIFGVLGVEIFFVLSGFLIGKIIINSLVENPSINSLKEFYLRRWLRTLPLYYLVLFLVSIIENVRIPNENFVFMQNFNKNALGFLPVSWSLSVEEWFYLLFPLILIIALNLFNKKCNGKKIFFIVTFSIALFSFVLRSYVVLKLNPVWDYGVRKQVFLRMDAMMLGVILAGVKVYYKRIYEYITSSKLSMILSWIGFLIIAILYFGYLGSGGKQFNNSILGRIFMFSLMPITCLFFIASFETNLFINKVLIKYRILKVFNYISIMSYSIYLIHYNLYHWISTKYLGFEGLIISLLTTLIFAWILHILWELPFMKLRDKINFRKNTKIIVNIETIS